MCNRKAVQAAVFIVLLLERLPVAGTSMVVETMVHGSPDPAPVRPLAAVIA